MRLACPPRCRGTEALSLVMTTLRPPSSAPWASHTRPLLPHIVPISFPPLISFGRER